MSQEWEEALEVCLKLSEAEIQIAVKVITFPWEDSHIPSKHGTFICQENLISFMFCSPEMQIGFYLLLIKMIDGTENEHPASPAPSVYRIQR